MEEWRPVVGYEGECEVSSLGRVRTCARQIDHRRNGKVFRKSTPARLLKPISTPGYAYLFVLMPARWVNGLRSKKKQNVHGLVARAFLGPRPSGKQAAHDDGNSHHNAASNLLYKTPKENAADKIRHGTEPPSEKCSKTKLSREQVREIRLLAPYDSQRALADHYGVHKSNISYILTGKSWCSGPWGTPKWQGGAP